MTTEVRCGNCPHDPDAHSPVNLELCSARGCRCPGLLTVRDDRGPQIRVIGSALVDLEYSPGEFVRDEDSIADFAARLYDAGFRLPPT